MKKIIITVAVALVAAVSLSARPTGLNIGGGLGYSGWTPYTEGQIDYLTAYAEVGYDLRVAKQSYIYFGCRYQEGLSASVNNIFYTMGDLFVPIRFQQNFALGAKGSTFYIEAGPAMGVLLYGKGTTVKDAGAGTGIYTFNTFEGCNRFNVYVGGNIGFNIHKHCKIYAGGDYGCISTPKNFNVNRWQLNLGACYVF